MSSNKRLISARYVQGQPIRLARSWSVVTLACAVLVTCGLFVVGQETWTAIVATQEGKPLPAGWTWTSIIAWDLFYVSLVGAICGFLLVQTLMVFTDEGVRFPHPFGHVAIRWNEVTRVVVDGGTGHYSLVVLEGKARSFKIRGIYFKDRNRLLEVIREHVSRAPERCEGDRQKWTP